MCKASLTKFHVLIWNRIRIEWIRVLLCYGLLFIIIYFKNNKTHYGVIGPIAITCFDVSCLIHSFVIANTAFWHGISHASNIRKYN